MINKLAKLLFSLFLLSPFAVAMPAKLMGIDTSQSSESARLVFKLTGTVPYQVFSLQNPTRFVLDLTDTRLAMPLQNLSLPNSMIKSVRTGYPKPTTLRLVFDLNHPVKFKIFTRAKKIFLDLYATNATKPSANVMPAVPAQNPMPSISFLKLPVLVSPQTAKPFIVIVDPGHGGKDPGALGVYGTKEKSVVLGIGLRLAKLINQQPNMRAVLTRDGDYFVTLGGRLKLARKDKADLFVAIHADSYFNNRANGASVYALSRRGATSLAARWLASRENHSELGGVDLRELEDQSLQLRSVLIDLAQTATTTDSLRLGNSVLDSLDSATNLHYSRVEQAPFMVLKSPDIPSILVEIGFLSNPKEEEKLRDERYQAKMAQALFNGIHFYVKKYSMAHL